MVKILSISDRVVSFLYGPQLEERFGDVDCVVACGDLPYTYQEYIISVLNVPFFFVRGNHDRLDTTRDGRPAKSSFGGIDVHRRVVRRDGLLVAGVEGSILYSRRTPFQYTQREMWLHVLRLIPGLLWNKIHFGRALDVFITHAPPRGIHEGQDWTHQGIDAFRWLVDTFQPCLHFHGHIHHYHPEAVTKTRQGRTTIINTYRYRITEYPADCHPLQKE